MSSRRVGGIDPGETLATSCAVLYDPDTSAIQPVCAAEAPKQDVVAWCVEMPRTRGATSGLPQVWADHETATIICMELAHAGFVVYAPSPDDIRSQVCGWPPRECKGLKFDAWWYDQLALRRLPVGKGQVLGTKRKEDTHVRDALACAMFATSHPLLIARWRFNNPFQIPPN